jgi:hypothetical protein
MRKKSNKNADKGKRLDPMIVVALIGFAGTIIAALLASPLSERLVPTQQPPVPTLIDSLTTTTSPPTSQAATPLQASNTGTGAQLISKPIRLNQTVTGTLYGSEAGIWTFSEGPATVTIILDVGPFGAALIIVKDPSGVDRAYRDEQKSPGVTQLVNFLIPTEGDYTIWVRNTANEQVDYTLTVQDARTPPPP